MELSCDNCGILFDRPDAWVGRSKTVCCSRECSYELKVKNSTKDCLQCGQAFYSTSHQKEKKYCSLVCAGAAKKKMEVMLICRYCGNGYNVKPSRKHSKYCSISCLNGQRRLIKESVLTI